jgi:N,N-dimethylformamidase beta subunit-like, C-terminal
MREPVRRPSRRLLAATTIVSVSILVGGTGAGPGEAAGRAAAHVAPAREGIPAAFERLSYAAGAVASLRLYGDVDGLGVQVFHAGPEQGRTRANDVMRGVPVSATRRIGQRLEGRSVRVPLGAWPSGLYFARLTSVDGRLGYAPFVLRPRALGEHRVAVVLPSYTWQAYNFRDEDDDGLGDTWYANTRQRTVRLYRTFLDRGVPPHYRHYDVPFLHWVERTGKRADYLADIDLETIPARTLAEAYDLIVFPGHHEYVTTREYDHVEAYRDLGGNLMFLSANSFFWRVLRRGQFIERARRWRDLGRPEAAIIGVGYLASDRGDRKGPWIVRTTASSPWLFEGTGLRPGSRFGSGGVEIDHTAASSPARTLVLAEIPRLYGPRYTAQMTLYETPAGAKVFAAGAFLFTESILEPDAPLPDARARASARGARRMLENLWERLSSP